MRIKWVRRMVGRPENEFPLASSLRKIGEIMCAVGAVSPHLLGTDRFDPTNRCTSDPPLFHVYFTTTRHPVKGIP
jgi:hypothetical protein